MLQKIETKFGIIHIEDLHSQREEDDRIKIFDSGENYMEYFALEDLEDCAEECGHTVEEELNIRIKNFKECDTIEDLVSSIFWTWDLITKNPEEIEEYLENNEWLNTIGEYYVVIPEC